MTVFARLLAFAAVIIALAPPNAIASSSNDRAAVLYKYAHRRAVDQIARGELSGSDLESRTGVTSFNRASELERRGLKVKRCPAPAPAPAPSPSPATTSHPTAPKPTTTSAHKATTTTVKPAAGHPAAAPADDGNNPSPPSGPSGKKALAWSTDGDFLKNFGSSGASIMYTWGATCPPQAKEYNIECASMLWSPAHNLDAFKAAAPSHKYLMGFNEFNLASQANMDVGYVVKAWNEYIRIYSDTHYLVSPSVASTNDALSVMQTFLKTCGNNKNGKDDNCGLSAVSIHYYTTDSQKLIDYATKMHEGLNNLDIWLTEFACEDFSGKTSCSASQAQTFLREVGQWAESTSWMKMWAPYGFASNIAGGYGGVNNVNAMLTSSGSPSAMGKVYNDL